ncbi:uncharacterized protein DS421_14g451660 [Arachis hypogaea]|nr:uncharacterized protein DS421_14g451660 [Arachis hypogaea]
MKTQTMPAFIMVLLMVALSFGSEARRDVHYCEARESVQHCNSPDCYNLCYHKYSSALGFTSGFCYNDHICDCFYYSYNPDCHAIMP